MEIERWTDQPTYIKLYIKQAISSAFQHTLIYSIVAIYYSSSEILLI